MTDLVLERADLLDGLFPSSVQWRCRRDLASPASLLPQELALIEGAVPKRVTEFATGRQCAREALRDLGIADVPILFGKDRCPLWPVGTVGSITHTASFFAAAVARCDDVRSIGLDAERFDAVEPELWHHFCTPTELARLERMTTSEQRRAATLAFSAKEAFFKCLYQIRQSWIDFLEAAVEVCSDGMFVVRSARLECLLPEYRLGLPGRFVVLDDLMVTAIVIPQRTDAIMPAAESAQSACARQTEQGTSHR